jgi:hypothetical protein
MNADLTVSIHDCVAYMNPMLNDTGPHMEEEWFRSVPSWANVQEWFDISGNRYLFGIYQDSSGFLTCLGYWSEAHGGGAVSQAALAEQQPTG